MPGLTVEFPASVAPVSLAFAKNFLRVDDIDEDDDLINALIWAATDVCERWTNRSFISKGFIQALDSFPYFTDTMLSQNAYPPSYNSLPRYSTTMWNYSQMIKLFRPPLISVDRITFMSSPDQSFRDLVPQPLPWYPQTVYTDGAQVSDSNGNVQTLVMGDPSNTATGKTGTKPPTWNKTQNQFTVEASPATAIWRNDGPLPQGEFGAFIVDKIWEPARLFPGIQTPGPTPGYWPSVMYVPNAVQIHYTAGYGPNPSDVPHGIRSAILQLVASLYETREPAKDDEQTLPPHVKMMLWPYRVLDMQPTRG
jgi:hypothetical protein